MTVNQNLQWGIEYAKLGIWMKVEHLHVLWLVLAIETICAVITLLLINPIKMLQYFTILPFLNGSKDHSCWLATGGGEAGAYHALAILLHMFILAIYKFMSLLQKRILFKQNRDYGVAATSSRLTQLKCSFPQFFDMSDQHNIINFFHVLPNWANNTIDCGLYLVQVKTQHFKNIKRWTSTWICSTEPRKILIVWSRAWLETCQAARADPVVLGRIFSLP